MSRSQRDKGRNGERMAELLLLDRDYTNVERLPCGRSGPDIVCDDPHGRRTIVEVKNRSIIALREHRKQARANAQKHHGRWLLMCKLPDSRTWLIEQQGHRPTLWHN